MRRTILVFASLLFIVASCHPIPESSGPVDAIREVVVLGDSITYSATDELNAVFANDLHVVQGEIGHTVGAMAPTIDSAVVRQPDHLVIALGTNNMGSGWTETDDAEIARVVDVTTGMNVIWVVPVYGSTGVVNALTGTHIEMARWDLFSAEHPEWAVDVAGHLTAEGQVAFAQFISDSIA